jgi:hypothetical protein
MTLAVLHRCWRRESLQRIATHCNICHRILSQTKKSDKYLDVDTSGYHFRSTHQQFLCIAFSLYMGECSNFQVGSSENRVPSNSIVHHNFHHYCHFVVFAIFFELKPLLNENRSNRSTSPCFFGAAITYCL